MAKGNLDNLMISALGLANDIERLAPKWKADAERIRQDARRFSKRGAEMLLRQVVDKAKMILSQAQKETEGRSEIEVAVDRLVEKDTAAIAKENEAFRVWKKKVDAALDMMADVTSEELPDKDYWAWFASGMSPKAAARKALAEEGF